MMRAVCPACKTGYDISKPGKYQCGVCGKKFFVFESSAAENLNESVPPPPESVDSGSKTEQSRKKITIEKDILLKLIVLVIVFTLLGGIWCYKNGSAPSTREEPKHLEAEQELPAKEQEKAEAQKAEQKRLAEERERAEQRRLAEEKRLAEERKKAGQKRLAEERERAEQRRLAEEKRLAEERKAGYLNQIAQDEERGFKFSKDKRTLLKAPENITTYTIPHGVTRIGKEAFSKSGCSKQVEQNYSDRIRTRVPTPTSQKKSPPGKKTKKQKKQAKPKHTPTLEENLTPEQIDRKIAIFRSRIVNASTEKIPSEYKERLLEAFDDLTKTQIGRYIFEKAHPDISFGVKNMLPNACYVPGSKCVVVAFHTFRRDPLKVSESLAHEVMHSIQHINGMIGAPEKSLVEKVTVSKLMELSSKLAEILVRDQMGKLPKYRHLTPDGRVVSFREIKNAKIAMGSDEDTAERFARTKVVEIYWSGRFRTPMRVGNKNILLHNKFGIDVGNWNMGYSASFADILVGEKRSPYEAMRDKGITPHIQKYIQLMGINTPSSFFKDPKTRSFAIPNSKTAFTYLNGVKKAEVQILAGTGKMVRYYDHKGRLTTFRPRVKEKKGADGNRSYTEYHEGTRIKRATYTYRNGKMSGVYREYDQQGRQILEVPVENNNANGNGWVMENGKRVLKTFIHEKVKDGVQE